MNEELKRLTNRHIAKTLDALDEIQCPQLYKDAFKTAIWNLANDVQDNIISREQVNGRKEITNH